MLENFVVIVDGDEFILFEFYVMYFKGVICLFVKQVEFGWIKDNKVIFLVDVVEIGLVIIFKFVVFFFFQFVEVFV